MVKISFVDVEAWPLHRTHHELTVLLVLHVPVAVLVAQSHPYFHIISACFVPLSPQNFVSLSQETRNTVCCDGVVGRGMTLENRHSQWQVMLSLLVIVPLGSLSRNGCSCLTDGWRCWGRIVVYGRGISIQSFFVKLVGTGLPVARITGGDLFLRVGCSLPLGLRKGAYGRPLRLV